MNETLTRPISEAAIEAEVKATRPQIGKLSPVTKYLINDKA